MSQLRLDLGIRKLLPEWRAIFSLQYLREDFVAGALVSCVALPLSLAIALASNVQPETGLVTAIVAGIVCALFGGTPLAVSGPASALPVLIAAIVEQFGMTGLFFVGMGCGILQVMTGIFGLGRLIRYVPSPVVLGFTAGIGALVLIGQIPRILGLPANNGSHVLDVIIHIRDYIHQFHFPSFCLSISTILITFLLPKVFPRVPSLLVAFLAPTLAAVFLGLQVETISVLPNIFKIPQFQLPRVQEFEGIMLVTTMVFLVASLESLLSSSAIDKLNPSVRKHDPNQELIGQGLGNIASSLMNGIPVTSAIARSALSLYAGGKTRRAAIFQSLILLVSTVFGAAWLGYIPVAVLAGVIISVSLRMLHPRQFIQLLKISKTDAAVYLTTFSAIIFVGLIAGVQAGLAIALVIALLRLTRNQLKVELLTSFGAPRLRIHGSLTFLSSAKIEKIQSRLRSLDAAKGLVIDLSEMTGIDISGASQLIQMIEPFFENHGKVAFVGLRPEEKRVLLSLDKKGIIASRIAENEGDIGRVLSSAAELSSFDRLLLGVERFRNRVKKGYQPFFQSLAEGQKPHTLFITCSDSRIDPNLITSTQPGELFVVRNVGNIIPEFGKDDSPAEGAAVEYALSVLGVTEVIVCGHSGCGAMQELLSGNIFKPENAARLPSVAAWLAQSRDIRKKLPSHPTAKQAAEFNAVMQLEKLKTYPLIQEKLRLGLVKLHAWHYDIGRGELEEWDEERQIFLTLGTKSSRELEKRIEAGIQFQVPLED